MTDSETKESVNKRLRALRSLDIGPNINKDNSKVSLIRPIEHSSEHDDHLSTSADHSNRRSQRGIPDLTLFNLYFLIKALFFYRGIIGFHPWENLLFAGITFLPIQHRLLYTLRNIVLFPLGLFLFYYDSWLPSLTRLFSLSSQIQGFSISYMVEVVSRTIDIQIIASSLLLIVAYIYLARWIRFSAIIIGLFSTLIFHQPSEEKMRTAALPATQHSETTLAEPAPAISSNTINPQSFQTGSQITKDSGHNSAPLDGYLNAFYAQERQRKVSFTHINSEQSPFDIIVMNVCSLSWSDLEVAGQHQHRVFDKFDFIFKNFNSAASYSSPASIRLVRSACGQSSHNALYKASDPECLLFGNLKRVGFTTEWLLNHDGNYDHYRKLLQTYGGFLQSPLSNSHLPTAQRSFDLSPIYNDYASLQYWLDKREKSEASRVALFYNSISLHDGNILTNHLKHLDSSENFNHRVKQLLDDLDRFMLALKASNRNFVVVLVPEHGAAIEGDKIQIAGLRDIPTPSITHVPVGISIIGPQWIQSEQTTLTQPTSYLSIAYILSYFIKNSPFDSKRSIAPMLNRVPTTPMVSENEDSIVIKKNDQYFLNIGDSDWIPYE